MSNLVNTASASRADQRLLEDGSNLISCIIEKRLIQQLRAKESQIHQIARRGLQCLAVLGGFGARIPFTRIPIEYANGNLIYGIPLAIGSAVSFGALISWCLLKIIDRELPVQFEEEKSAERLRQSCLKKTLIKTGIFVVGMLSQAPLAYMAYVYNDKNIFFPIAAVVVDSSVPIYSLSLSAEKMLSQKKLGKFEEKLSLLKLKALSALIEISEETDLDIWHNRIVTINNLQMQESDKVKTLINRLFENIDPAPKRESCLVNSGRWGARSAGFVLSASQLIMYAVLGYNGMQLFSEEPFLWYLGATVIVLSNLYLNMKMTIEGSLQGYDITVNLCRGRTRVSRQSIHHPILQKTLYILAYIACILSFAGPVKVSQDYFTGPMSLYMQTSTALGTVVLSALPCMDLVNEVIEERMAKKDTEEIRQIMKIVHEIRHVINLISKSSLLEFAKFTREISNPVIDQWCEELEITAEQLHDYINTETAQESDSASLLV